MPLQFFSLPAQTVSGSATALCPLGPIRLEANQAGISAVTLLERGVDLDAQGEALATKQLQAQAGANPQPQSRRPHNSPWQFQQIHSPDQHIHQLLQQACAQLDAYFARELQQFDLPLAPGGTVFQQQVWQQLCQLPYGSTASYGALASTLGKPAAMRAVGAANGRNPIAIIVPCHRVIATNGRLTGYAGGLSHKLWLLQFEASAN